MSVYFSEDHEWISVDGNVGTVGITVFAQGQLGDITFVDLPAAGQRVNKGDSVSVVDSVKAAADVYSPASGAVTENNPALEGEPELVNNDPEAAGWLFRLTLSDPGELSGMMDRKAYDAFVEGL